MAADCTSCFDAAVMVSGRESSPDFDYEDEYQKDDSQHQTSFESDAESDRENRGPGGKRLRKYTTDKVVETCMKKANPRYQKRKQFSLQDDLSKRFRPEESYSSGDGPTNSSNELPLGEEVKGALKEITSLLNTVVKRVERVEKELQQQKSASSSSSTEITPPRIKPSLAVKVSLFTFPCAVSLTLFCFTV